MLWIKRVAHKIVFILTIIPEKSNFNEKYTIVMDNKEMVVTAPVWIAMCGFLSLNPFITWGIRA